MRRERCVGGRQRKWGRVRLSDDGRSGRGSAPFLNLHATARYKEQEKNEDVPIRFHGLIVMLKQNHCRKAVMAPPRRLELRSSAPEADTLSTELRGQCDGILSQVHSVIARAVFFRPWQSATRKEIATHAIARSQ